LTRLWNFEARFVVAGTNEFSMSTQKEIFDYLNTAVASFADIKNANFGKTVKCRLCVVFMLCESKEQLMTMQKSQCRCGTFLHKTDVLCAS
jgi:hypothetical protein